MKNLTEISSNVSQNVADVVWFKGESFGYYKSGNTRHVYTNKDKTKVLKVVMDKLIDYNQIEADIFNTATDKSQFAETRLDGIYIIQEFCRDITEEDDLTIGQVQFARSCRNEVGFNSKGKLVCYDLDEFKKY